MAPFNVMLMFVAGFRWGKPATFAVIVGFSPWDSHVTYRVILVTNIHFLINFTP
jgi:hypothetical protein